MTHAQTAAFHRLLADAQAGGQAKVDAMVALAQRTVFVVPWPAGIEGFRTLVNSEGIAALPIFTVREELEEAARRFAWLAADGSAPAAEIGARNALNYAIQQNLKFVVIDIAADHALELMREEYEPLLSEAARRDSQGPYAAAGRISRSLKQRVTPTPGSIPSQKPIGPPKSVPPAAMTPPVEAPSLSASTDFNPAAASFGGGASATLSPLGQVPPDALYDALTTVLRGYPEVEWAALCAAARGPTAPVPAVALRIDPSFRQRVAEILSAVRNIGVAHGASLDTVLLDDPALMRTARACGVFYPWRKK